MLVLGYDTETTGLNVSEDHITQVGAVLFDTDAKYPVVQFTAFLKGPHLPPLLPEIVELTKITNTMIDRWGHPPHAVLSQIEALMERADAVVAHNGNLFDKPMHESNCKRHGLKPIEKLWIDTSCDIEFPAHIQTRRLSHLAGDHGFLNPFPHNALADVLTMLNIADRYDWAKIVEYAKAPTLTIRADSTFQQKELCKKQNYRWNAEQKIWTKSIKQFQLEEVKKAAMQAGFGITVLKGNK
jgi:DNA polymerase-3 subunit epsilon